VDQLLTLFGAPQRITARLLNSRLIGLPSVPDSFQIQLHYPPSSSTPSRSLPLIATAQSSSLSLITPQQRFLIKGTKASFIKHGLDVQEDQLKKFGKDAVGRNDFGVEVEESWGKLYRVENPGEVERVKSEQGSYRSWFENVAEVSSLFSLSLLAFSFFELQLIEWIFEDRQSRRGIGRN